MLACKTVLPVESRVAAVLILTYGLMVKPEVTGWLK